MATKNVNKVIVNGTAIIDLTADTVTAGTLLSGYKAHDKSGTVVTGSYQTHADWSGDATVDATEILSGEVAYGVGNRIVGTMPNNGAQTGTISDKNGSVTISQGYHDGSGNVTISSTEKAKIIATNIRSGVTILGVTGSMSGTEGAKAQARTATPTFTAQTILPQTGYNYLSQVTVNAIPVTYADNDQGGQTCTIG